MSAPRLGPAPEDEFRNLLGDDQEDVARQRQAMRRQVAGVARRASLTPDNGMDI
ncbi:hypothetical protein [Paracoccus yeei]|uniref:hypothetical protein n=1 Tax=Paracoccus yeei TaxID=147645 RepID=UPI001749BFA6|nr:hypothetical protein [Paracoccus yeei]